MESRQTVKEQFEKAILTRTKLAVSDFVKNHQAHFNTPKSFLFIVKSANAYALDLILRHIKTQPEDIQQTFLTYVDADGRHALMLAAACNHPYGILSSLWYLNFDYNAKDKFNHTTISYLIRNKHTHLALHLIKTLPTIHPEDAKQLSAEKDSDLSYTTKIGKKEIGNGLTYSPDGVKQSGRLPKTITKEEPRPYRTFADQRERQLLRQASVQLYHVFENEFQKSADTKGQLVEVQMMHLNFDNKHSLFIAVNQHTISQKLAAIVKDRDNFTKMLTDNHSPVGDKEGAVRSLRYARKLRARIFAEEGVNIPLSTSEDDKKQSNAVASLLHKSEILPLPIEVDAKNTLSTSSRIAIRNLLQGRENTIYIINVKSCPIKLRHAEEFLTDIAEYSNQVARELKKSIYTCIAGKKRHCMGCLGRMTGVINQYNPYPGRFWVNTLENQSTETMPKTVRVVLSSKSYISVGKSKKSLRDYDSGSDTDEMTESKREARVKFKP